MAFQLGNDGTMQIKSMKETSTAVSGLVFGSESKDDELAATISLDTVDEKGNGVLHLSFWPLIFILNFDAFLVDGHISESQWQCTLCTYFNDDITISCAMCGNAKDSAPNLNINISPKPQNKENQEQWACPMCTFINEPNAVVCGVCSSARIANSPKSHDEVSRLNGSKPWSCPICTLQNQSDTLQCAACGHRAAEHTQKGMDEVSHD